MAWTKSPQSLIDLFDKSVPSSDRRNAGFLGQFGTGEVQGLCSTSKEATVKKFVLLHYGFEKPTPDIMTAWGKWFEAMKDKIIDMGGHFSRGREISKAGTRDLPLGPESITGFTIVSASSLEDAEKMAQSNPFISSIRVYEVMSR